MRWFQVVHHLEKCERLWKYLMPVEGIFDLWETREIFHRHFSHEPHFLTLEDEGVPVGLAPLSWIEEEGYFGCFPGETWRGKTWLEGNRMVARDEYALRDLVASLPEPTVMRYLTVDSPDAWTTALDVDEIGYLFRPALYDYSFQKYLAGFTGSRRRKLEHELTRLSRAGVAFRHDCPDDVGRMFDMNLERYGDDSYFSDVRFRGAFEELLGWLNDRGQLRITSVLLGDRLAAVDVGSIVQNRYTLLAGGVHAGFPGVAKLINLHHLEYACQRKFEDVDFLCGDFGWKERFNLCPRPLFEMRAQGQSQSALRESVGMRENG